jgi:hypothetical protein
MENPAVSSPTQGNPSRGNFLGERRIKIALGIAVVEGLLVVVNVIPEWAVFVAAVAAAAYWWMSGRHSSSPSVRQASWILAASQIFLMAVPLFFIFFKTVAYVALAILAIVALVFLFTERDHSG